ncbi:hypothetical protein FB451DRAFT_1565780 [Mycena latifolia]|nr:hypothetical protein FB451DRAFT_1565780 [Mycena latifolia]
MLHTNLSAVLALILAGIAIAGPVARPTPGVRAVHPAEKVDTYLNPCLYVEAKHEQVDTLLDTCSYYARALNEAPAVEDKRE